MRSNVFRYLKTQCSTNPTEVDKFIISAFLLKNGLVVKKNTFLKGFIINQSRKEDYQKLLKFVTIIDKEIGAFGIEELIEIFEFVISPADRKINGAIYTPKYIRKFIIEKAFESQRAILSKSKVVDIACGCGGFIADAAIALKRESKRSYYKIFKSQIFGLDVQSYSITRTKLLLTVIAILEGEDRKSFKFNLCTGDALNFNWSKKIKKFKGFDIILGNPPYVCSRHISEESKKHLSKWEVCNSGHPDLYIPFFQIGIENLSRTGTLGYITMNSFVKSLNGRALREYFKKSRLNFKIIDFGTEQVFRSRNTYTCICLIEKREAEYIEYLKLGSKELASLQNFNQINYSTLDSHKGWNLQNNEIISIIESTGVSFGEIFKTRNGIATLKNEIYIFNPINEDKDYYYLQNGSVYEIEKEICRDIVNSNKLSAVGGSLHQIKEKVIFPYDSSDKPKLLNETYLKANFPKAHKYLTHKKDILAGRDKGKGEYDKWFAFGRTQSLEKMKYKLLFPQISNKTPNYIINSDDNLLFYNGLALIGESRRELVFVKKLMETKLFWYYITQTSKPYMSGYFSLSNNYIKNFGVCKLTNEEIDFVVKTEDRMVIDDFFEAKYGVEITDVILDENGKYQSNRI